MYEHNQTIVAPVLCSDGLLVGAELWGPNYHYGDPKSYWSNTDGRYSRWRSERFFDNFSLRLVPRCPDRWLLAPSVPAFQRALELPFLSDDDRLTIERWLGWRIRLTQACLTFQVDRGSTDVDPRLPKQALHRRVMRYRKQDRQVRRELTDQDRHRLRQGYSLQELKPPVFSSVSESLPFASATYDAWYSYLPVQRRPYSQQVLGAEAMYQARRLAVWYTMRTGKTPMTFAVANRLRAEGEVTKLLVVAPKVNLYDPWVKESKLMGWYPVVLDGTYEEDEAALAAAEHMSNALILVNYERVDLRQDLLDRYLVWPETYLACDESSAIRNPRARRTQALWELGARDLAGAVLLNGTPIEQGTEDYYAQCKVIDPFGLVWGATFEDYSERWLQRDGRKFYVPKGIVSDYQFLLAMTSIRCVESEADQFNGRSQQFTYHVLPPTKYQLDQARNLEAGFIQLAEESEDVGQVNAHILSLYQALRELACGWSKYKLAAGLPYERERHEVDPKSLWVEAYFAANPTQPVVFFVEFDEHQMVLGDLLKRLGISFRGFNLPPTETYRDYITCPWDDSLWVEARQYVAEQVKRGYRAEYPDWDERSLFWRWDSDCVSFFWRLGSKHLTKKRTIKIGKKVEGAERARALADFNEGRAQVFICKHDEARGFALNRVEAVMAGTSVFPDIISLAPPWKLGAWEQACSRCMTPDPRTGRSVCTPIRVLTVGERSIEAKILKALRSKKDVQSLMLKDAERRGFTSFVSDLVEGLNVEGAEFQLDLMVAKILLGYPPYLKLTEVSVFTRAAERLQMKSRREAEEWFRQLDARHLNGAAWGLALRNEEGQLERPDGDTAMAVYRAACVLLAEIRGDISYETPEANIESLEDEEDGVSPVTDGLVAEQGVAL